MKKLPKIYHEDINKAITNNKEVYYSKYEESKSVEEKESESVDEVLKKVFNGIGYSFNIPLKIITNNKTYETSLIGKTGNYLITFDDDTIPLSEVKEIKILK